MDYIYHYTTLPSLISMISNNQLRLMRLDRFLELYDADFPIHWDSPWSYGLSNRMKNIYISSWISDSEESLSKWNFFSNLDNGVRLKINTRNSFDEFDTCDISRIVGYGSLYFNSTWFQIKKIENKMSISKVSIIENKDLSQIMNFDDTNKTSEDFEKQRKMIDTLLSARVDSIASQNEIRLQVKTSVPLCPNKKREQEEYERDLKKDDNIHYISVSLPSVFFKDIEILVSPNFSEENLLLLQSFLSEQGLNASVQKKHIHMWL